MFQVYGDSRLKGKYLSDDGTAVDYVGLKADSLNLKTWWSSSILLTYVNWILLNAKPFSSVTSLLTFIKKGNDLIWNDLDVYNTLTIHGLAKCDPLPKSVTDISNFWKTTAYVINGHVFTLDDIEHGILRSSQNIVHFSISKLTSFDYFNVLKVISGIRQV